MTTTTTMLRSSTPLLMPCRTPDAQQRPRGARGDGEAAEDLQRPGAGQCPLEPSDRHESQQLADARRPAQLHHGRADGDGRRARRRPPHSGNNFVPNFENFKLENKIPVRKLKNYLK